MRTLIWSSIALAVLTAACSTPAENAEETPPPVQNEPLEEPIDETLDPEVEVPVEPDKPLYPEVFGVPLAEDINADPTIVEVELTAAPSLIELVAGKQTAMWTFGGQLPGPLIQARVGDRIIVHLKNDLPDPTTIHWHGLRVPNAMDGTPRTQTPVQPGETFTYDFIAEDAGTFWYHPHYATHQQVERGLYGVMVIHEAEEPAYDVERIVFLDDVALLENGGLVPFGMSHMVRMHGRFGNTLLLNGKAVAGNELFQLRRGSVERWRILNSANARTANIDLIGAEWRVIGWDGGIIPQPYTTKMLRIAPGERYDIEVKWSPKSQGDVGELRFYVPVAVGDGVQLQPLTIRPRTVLPPPWMSRPMGAPVRVLPSISTSGVPV